MSDAADTLIDMSQLVAFEGIVWQWDARKNDAWYFVTLPPESFAETVDRMRGERGFGSVKVKATIGTSTWKTSIFPDKSSGSYVLPLKKAVRTAEGIDADGLVKVTVELVVGS